MIEGIEIQRITDPSHAQAAPLVAESHTYLGSLYAQESNHAEELASLITGGSAFYMVSDGNTPAACGAVKFVTGADNYAEIKSLFVRERYRGNGLATVLMECLEANARDRGVTVVRLEAGPKQPEALNLYRKLGYYDRGPFGTYRDDPLSVFMEKRLGDKGLGDSDPDSS
jgi:putative acetyltransferase